MGKLTNVVWNITLKNEREIVNNYVGCKYNVKLDVMCNKMIRWTKLIIM